MSERQHPGLRVTWRRDGSLPTPLRFGLGEGDHDVAEVQDRWFGEGYVYAKVRTPEGGTYILRHDEERDAWEVTCFRAGPD
ncbi:MAG: hypothetical protein JSV95_13430 [Gemmatimonadota bacterium]|jgi:hypothetical protein|nr:MAG: hypothetical protein JSV95_13430 [Gemmatimonadota bacterium]